MSLHSPPIQRTNLLLEPDRARILVRPFFPTGEQRAVKMIARVVALSEREVDQLLGEVLAAISDRHQRIREFLLMRFEVVRPLLLTDLALSENRRLLLGAFFTQEYSFEAAALCDPSIVPHPDQSDVMPGSLRFILSLRAVGEVHISSLTFRTGVVDAQGAITLAEPTRCLTEPHPIPNALYEKAIFLRKLEELNLAGEFAQRVMASLGDSFTLEELHLALAAGRRQRGGREADADTASRLIWSLARFNYEVQFFPDQLVSERIIFPPPPSEKTGVEDARFVRFRQDDGTITYYATYTAFDGKFQFPQLLETSDFLRFRFATLNGPAAQNNGLALFPRKINGAYAMLSRQDNENISLMFSDHPHFWQSPEVLLKPTFPWEFVQLGNCGSPIETEAGWLVLSHGVGPMHRHAIGAFLLDLQDPRKVIGRLRQPLLAPNEDERDGYAPNVVYSCGALVHAGKLILPYAFSDYATRFSTVDLPALLRALVS